MKVAVMEGVDGELVGEKVEEGFVGDGFKGFCGSCDQALDDGLTKLFDGRGIGFSRGGRVGLRGVPLRGRSCFCGGWARFFRGLFC